MTTKSHKILFRNISILIQIFIGSTLFYLSARETSQESTFLFMYSFSKSILLFIHLLLIFLILYLFFKQNSKKPFKLNKKQKSIVNNIINTTTTTIASFIMLICLLIINSQQESLPFWYVYQKAFYLLFFITSLIVNLTIDNYVFSISTSNKKTHEFFLFFVILITITINIHSNTFAKVNSEWFETYQKTCDSLIMGKLVNWNLGSSEDKSIFMVQYVPPEEGDTHIFTQHLMEDQQVITSQDYSRIQIYTAQVGLQGLFFGIISKLVYPAISLNSFYKIILLTTSTLLGFSLTTFLYWLKREFNWYPVFLTWFTIVLNKWLTVGGKSTYWQYWLFFLGFIWLLFYIPKKTSNLHYFGIIFITTFIKFLSGYEYTSSFLIMLSLPLFYYAFTKRIVIKEFIKMLIQMIGISIFSFIISIGILFLEITYFFDYEGEWKSPWHVISYRVSKRTGFGNINQINTKFHESLNIPIKEILKIYFTEGKPLIGELRAIQLIYILILLLICIIIISQISKPTKKLERIKGLSIITSISILAPISWFILAKGHSYLHPHFNYFLFSMPFLLVLPALLATTIEYLFQLSTIKKEHR